MSLAFSPLTNFSAALDAPLATAEAVRIGYALKDLCLDGWSSEPAQSLAATRLLHQLSNAYDHPEIAALTLWADGLAALINGQMDETINLLDAAANRFFTLNQPHTAATTQISKLIALAMLGRYGEAIECALSARDICLQHNDLLSAGKIENNLGNIYYRRDLYHEAEHFHRRARERFIALNHQTQLAKINNSLATILTLLHRFRAAEELYADALHAAETAGLTITQAEIEASLGNLALWRGRYDQALDWLERSRRKYAALGLPHQSAIAELELAEAYAELSLWPEAAEICARITPVLAAHGLRSEQARVAAQHGQALLQLSQLLPAQDLLHHAATLYTAEKNNIGVAGVRLAQAGLAAAQTAYTDAARLAADAETTFASIGTWRRALLARWLRGEAARVAHQPDAHELLTAALHDATHHEQPALAYRCHTSLGLLALAANDTETAISEFQHAVALVEELRAPLPDESFRTAFFADKLTPYHKLAEIHARAGRTAQAFGYIEQARARALAEQMPASSRQPAAGSRQQAVSSGQPAAGSRQQAESQQTAGSRQHTESEQPAADSRQYTESQETVADNRQQTVSDSPRPTARRLLPTADSFTATAETRLSELREELNWFYNRLERPTADDAPRLESWREAAREREQEIAQLSRQLQHSRPASTVAPVIDDLATLAATLGPNAALLEYVEFGGRWHAFVVTATGVQTLCELGTAEEVQAALAQFHFQINSLRHGAARLRQHLPQLTRRTQQHLARLYDLLLRPIVPHLPKPDALTTSLPAALTARLIIVPHAALHYVPFHALCSGSRYLIEDYEVSYAPSAAVWLRCAARPAQNIARAVLCGVPDDFAPRVQDEVETLARLFPNAVTLLGAQATRAAVREVAPTADILHLACHGQFRPDNPLFSALKLADGWLTVREAATLPLRAELVTLSACETGVHHIAAGDEILGLARGFLTAGAASLILSLWTVDDAATAALMSDFYQRLCTGARPAEALRQAQLLTLQQHPHPFFWSPFMLLGR